MAEISDLNVTDASNTARWPEGMAPSAVNDAGRAMEGYLARWFNDWNASITASGSSNAFTATSNRTISSLVNNTVIAFTANHTITGAPTLNLNSLGAKSIKRFNGNALASGDIVSGQPVMVIYKSSPDCWFMQSAAAALTGNSFADFDENASPGDPASDDARLYAVDDGGGITIMAYRDSGGLVTPLRTSAIIKRAYAETTSLVSCTGLIPFDDTIPQQSEGTEVLTCSITPQRASNRIRVTFSAFVGHGAAGVYACAALFRDANAAALDARGWRNSNTGGDGVHIGLVFEHSPGVAVSTTYKVRIGSETTLGSGTPSTVNVNGGLVDATGRRFGGASRATLVLEEIVA